MSLKELLGALRGREQSERAKAKAAYLELVHQAARGKVADADRAADVLDRAGRTAEDFERDVRRAANRQELRARIERARLARPKLRKLELRAKEIEEAFILAQQKFATDLESLQAEAQPLQQICSLASGAEGELVATCPDDELLRDYREACRELGDASEAVRYLKMPLEEATIRHSADRLVRKVREAIRHEERSNSPFESREKKTDREERLKKLGAILADPVAHIRAKHQPRLDEAEARRDALQAERDRLERLILEA